jgi:hypothetical protein
MLKKFSILQKELGVSRNTLYAMRKAGLKTVNVGAGSRRPTLAADDQDVIRFLERPLRGEVIDRIDAQASAARQTRRPGSPTGRAWKPRPVASAGKASGAGR